MKTFLAFVASLTLAVSAFAGGSEFNYGSTSMIQTQIPLNGFAESFTNGTRGAISSGGTTNGTFSAPNNALSRVEFFVSVTNGVILIHRSTTTATNENSVVAVVSNGAPFQIRYPFIDNKTEFTAVTQPGTAFSNRVNIIGHEYWGLVQ